MKRLLLTITLLTNFAHAQGVGEFSAQVRGCSIDSYREALDVIEKESEARGVGGFGYCPGTLVFLERGPIRFLEIKMFEFSCDLKAKTNFYCAKMSW